MNKVYNSIGKILPGADLIGIALSSAWGNGSSLPVEMLNKFMWPIKIIWHNKTVNDKRNYRSDLT